MKIFCKKIISIFKKTHYRYYITAVVLGVMIVFGIIYLIREPNMASADWWDDSWHYRQSYDVFNSATSTLTDFQVPMSTSTLGLSTLVTAGKLNSDFSDLRFTDNAGNPLEYFFTSNISSMSFVYVKFKNLPSLTTTTVYMYYGNKTAIDGKTPGDQMFYFFDDFSEGQTSFDSTWYKVANGSAGLYTVANGYLSISGSAIPTMAISPYSGNDYTIDVDLYHETSVGSAGGVASRYTDVGNYYHMELDATGLRLYRFTNFSFSSLGSTDCTNVADTWYTTSFRVLGSSIYTISYFHNVSRSATDSNFTSGRAGVYKWNSNMRFDNFIVRKAATADPTITLTAGTSEEKSESPIAYWSMDEGYGNIAHDNSSNKNHGTLTNMSVSGTSTSWVDGKFGKSLKFDGIDDYVFISDNTQNYSSFSAWIKTGSASEQVIASGVLDSYAILIQSGKIVASTASSLESLQTVNTFNDNNWHHVVVIKTGLTYPDNFELYVDGNRQEKSSNVNIRLGTKQLIGARYYGGSYSLFFNGSIDEVKIFDYMLSTSQIKKLYSSKAKDFSNISLSKSIQDKQDKRNEGLVGYWKMDENSWTGISNGVQDSSGVGNHGTAYSGANTTSTSKYGRAGIFVNDAGSYINLGTTNMLDFPTNDFTISTWVKPEAEGSILFRRGGGYHTSVPGYSITKTGFQIGSTNFVIFNSSLPGTLTDGVWSLLTYVVDRDGYLQKYINGVLTGQIDISAYKNESTSNNSSATISVSNTQDWAGGIDEMKIWNRALSPEEVAEEYTDSPKPVAYYSMDRISGTSVIDESVNAINATMYSMTKSAQKPGKYNQALKFDGVSYLNAGNSSTTNLNTPMSIGVWIKPSMFVNMAPGATGAGILGNSTYNNGGYFMGLFNSQNFVFGIMGSGVASELAISVSGYKPNEWMYLVMTYDGATTTAWINGIKKGEKASILSTSGNSLLIGDATQGGWDPFKGLIDDVKIYDYVLSPYQIVEEYNGGNSGKPIGYWSFDEGRGATANDNSSQKKHGTLTGFATNPWTNGKSGKGLNFNGSSYVNCGAVISNGEITFTAWFRGTNTSTQQTIFDLNGSSSRGNFAFNWNANRPILYLNGSNFRYFNASATDYLDGNWHYLVVYIPGAGISDISRAELYIDNKSIAPDSTVLSENQATWSNLYIGYINNSFIGDIDEVKIFNYKLTPSDMQKEFSSNGGSRTIMNLSQPKQETASTSPIGYWSMDQTGTTTVYDKSGNNLNGTMIGGMSKNNNLKPGKIGNALKFDGVNDYVEVPYTSTFDFTNTSEFTISTWVYVNKIPTSGNTIGVIGKFNKYAIDIYFSGSNLIPRWFVVDSGGQKGMWPSYTIPLNKWVNIMSVYSYINNKMYLYVDGVLIGSRITSDIGDFSANQSLFIAKDGAVCGGTPKYLNGFVDEVKIYNYAMTSAQVSKEYGGGKPMIYWDFDEGKNSIIHDRVNKNNGVLSLGSGGNTVTSSSWKSGSDCKKGNCMSFDGVDDYVNFGDVSSADWNGMTISSWLYWDGTSVDGYAVFLFKYPNDIGSHAINSSGKLLVQNGNGNFFSSSNRDFPSNRWAHYLYVYDQQAGKERIYVNGSLKGEQSRSGDIVQNSVVLKVPRIDNYRYSGYIDDLKIYNYALNEAQIKEDYNMGKSLFFK